VSEFEPEVYGCEFGTIDCVCCEIPVVGMVTDTSVRCTPGESWPYYLASTLVDVLREPVARAIRGIYI
jgi:hypothetical protein